MTPFDDMLIELAPSVLPVVTKLASDHGRGVAFMQLDDHYQTPHVAFVWYTPTKMHAVLARMPFLTLALQTVATYNLDTTVVFVVAYHHHLYFRPIIVPAKLTHSA